MLFEFLSAQLGKCGGMKKCHVVLVFPSLYCIQCRLTCSPSEMITMLYNRVLIFTVRITFIFQNRSSQIHSKCMCIVFERKEKQGRIIVLS